MSLLYILTNYIGNVNGISSSSQIVSPTKESDEYNIEYQPARVQQPSWGSVASQDPGSSPLPIGSKSKQMVGGGVHHSPNATAAWPTASSQLQQIESSCSSVGPSLYQMVQQQHYNVQEAEVGSNCVPPGFSIKQQNHSKQKPTDQVTNFLSVTYDIQ